MIVDILREICSFFSSVRISRSSRVSSVVRARAGEGLRRPEKRVAPMVRRIMAGFRRAESRAPGEWSLGVRVCRFDDKGWSLLLWRGENARREIRGRRRERCGERTAERRRGEVRNEGIMAGGTWQTISIFRALFLPVTAFFFSVSSLNPFRKWVVGRDLVTWFKSKISRPNKRED